ncbi:hypothetical protein IU418_13385 [Nocardia farcinica]|uniref:hypothetical protein n=1 Tax=Nocardia farcinica TaxID=37329 RepID=UPI001B3C681A|nr:hypothetical protein [Nocardia farcinica]MBF6538197.1 hypothetical protein [Nocardia farcinica]
MTTPTSPPGGDFPCCTTPTPRAELSREHLEVFAVDPHAAAESEVAAMARELLAARARVAELEGEQAKVRAHIEQRPEYIAAIEGGGSEDDVWRWRGGAEARRQLSEALGWTVPYQHGEKAEPKEGDHARLVEGVRRESAATVVSL